MIMKTFGMNFRSLMTFTMSNPDSNCLRYVQHIPCISSANLSRLTIEMTFDHDFDIQSQKLHQK